MNQIPASAPRADWMRRGLEVQRVSSGRGLRAIHDVDVRATYVELSPRPGELPHWWAQWWDPNYAMGGEIHSAEPMSGEAFMRTLAREVLRGRLEAYARDEGLPPERLSRLKASVHEVRTDATDYADAWEKVRTTKATREEACAICASERLRQKRRR
jgi:hypothetical protein